jgi:alpha-L-fucosidase
MIKKISLSLVLSLLVVCSINAQQKSFLNESEQEFETRLQWFTNAKYSMFIHFG